MKLLIRGSWPTEQGGYQGHHSQRDWQMEEDLQKICHGIINNNIQHRCFIGQRKYSLECFKKHF